jgi:Protein of unknown function (DUF1631)
LSDPSDRAPPGALGDPPPPRAARYLGACGQLLGSVLPPLMTVVFDRAEEALRDLGDKAPDTQLYSSYLDAGRILRMQRKDVQVNLFRVLRQGAAEILAPPPEPQAAASARGEPDSQELTLLQDAELEESLAIGNLTTKAESRYRPELLEMRCHLARLLGRERLPERSNPYGPFAICEAFRRALILAHGLEPPIRLVVYKLLDRHLMDRLGDFYKGCVALAVADGHVAGSGFAHLLRRRGADGVAAAPIPLSLPQTETLPFETLRGLLALQRPEEVPAHEGQARMQTGELLGVLSELGVQTLARGAITAEDLRSGLVSALAAPGAEAPALAREDEDTLDLVFLFFEHLLQGNDLPDPIKALIGRLQIPVAKLALLDKTFFSDQGHPARRLLNHMGQAAVGWSEDDDRGPEGLYGMIERVVERLILDFDDDPTLFAQMDRYFAAFIAREASSSRALEARTVPQLAAPAPESERQMLANLVEDYLGRYPSVPPVVESILREGWQPAMLATYRGPGPDSSAWRRGLELAERLLWSVQPKVDAEERRQLLRRIPEILRGLRAQLAGGGSDQRQLARWFRDLQTVHLAVLQGESAPPPAPATLLPGGSPGGGLGVGSWVELQGDEGGRARLKIAWVSPEGARYLLVDRQGRRGPELGRGELRALLERGVARVLGDGQEPIADRALRSVLARLAG